jgi:glycosyltransferase involved in cell wall biosynthesis
MPALTVKVLLLANKVPYPPFDGSSLAIRSMVEAYRQNEVAVRLLVLNTNKHHRDPATVRQSTPPGVEIDLLPVRTQPTALGALLNLAGPLPYHVSRFYQPVLKRALRALLKVETFDYIQLEGLAMAPYAAYIRRYSQAPVLLRAHNIEHHIWERHQAHEKNRLRRLYLQLENTRLRRYEKKQLQAMDGLLFIAAPDRDWYLKQGGQQPAEVFPCGTDAPQPDQEQPTPQYDITYLASLDWLPNQQGMQWFMEKVWPRIQDLRPGTTMALAGQRMPDHLRRWQSSRFHVIGAVEDGPGFIREGALTVVPLLAGSGMRVKLIENLAIGQPMVVTPQAAEGLPLENGQQLLIEQAPEAFARATVQLLEQPAKASALGQTGKNWVLRHYQHAQIGKRLLDFLQKG